MRSGRPAALRFARSSAFTRKAQTQIAVDDEAGEKLIRLVELLEDNDDVQHVYGNFALSDEMMAKLAED